MISPYISRPGRPSRAASRSHRKVRRKLGRAAAINVLRSRRSHERVIVGILGVAALVGIALESQARALARLAAWDRQRRLHDRRN
jgi:hypothetical protein